VNRNKLFEIIDKWLEEKWAKNLIRKFLEPHTISLPTGGIFIQERGVPQGMAISPILFITYLDELLKSQGLCSFKILGYADDLAFIAKDKTESCSIINKLRRLNEFLELNEKKCGILSVNDEDFSGRQEFMGIPIVN